MSGSAAAKEIRSNEFATELRVVYGDDSAAPTIEDAEFADDIIAMQRHQTAAGPKTQKCSAAGCTVIKPR